jgi:hypothetical protein
MRFWLLSGGEGAGGPMKEGGSESTRISYCGNATRRGSVWHFNPLGGVVEMGPFAKAA